jgi:hypothetical protein
MANISFLKDGLPKLIESVAAVPRFSHILLDFGFLEETEIAAKTALAARALNTIGGISDYASVIAAATGFPFNLSGLAKDDRVVRSEILLFEQLKGLQLNRFPTFGDYCIAHPEVDDEMDPRLMNPSPSIRYTSLREWIILKRRRKALKTKPSKSRVKTKKRDYTPFLQVCRDLMKREEYCGPKFSPGDAEIQNRARGTRTRPGPGSPMIWRKIGTSHHLTFVVQTESNRSA